MSDLLSAFAAFMSVVAVLVTSVLTYRLNRRNRLDEVEDLAVRYREPLLQSAHNLQSRLYNIVRQDFLGRFLAGGADERERNYAVQNTVYLFGQYLAWVELVRRDALYVDARDRKNNRTIFEHLESVRDTLAESTRREDRRLRLFRGEQRAVGEVMLRPASSVVGGRNWECMGYAAFVALHDDAEFQVWFRSLEQDVLDIAATPGKIPPRLTELQHALVDLIDVLDPTFERVAERWRGRL